MKQRGIGLVFLSSLCLGACGSGDGNAGDPDGGTGGPDGGINKTCSTPAQSNAWFRVSQNEQSTSFYGVHDDFETPQLAVERQRVGDCALFAHEPSLCDADCTGGICIDSECRAFPGQREAAAVTLELGTTELTLEQSEFGAYQDNFGAISAGLEAQLASAGNASVSAFDLAVRTVSPVTGALEGLVAKDGTDLFIEWEPAATDNPGDEVVVHLDSDHHGTAAYIECVVPTPATSVTIDKSLIDAILLIGETGIGTYIENAYIERRNPSYSLTDTDCVSLTAVDTRSLFVDSDHQ